MIDDAWVGRRVSVRRLVARDHFSDVVGDLIGLDAATAVVESRTGPVEVPRELIAAARLVEASTADILALEAVCAQGWRPALTAQQGGWTLRADSGFTGRANSVLPLRPPGAPLADALAQAAAWYAERDLPLLVQAPLPARSLLDNALSELGFGVRGEDTAVLIRRLTPSGAGTSVTLAPDPDPEWLGQLRGGRTPPAAVALIRRHDRVVFASLRDGGRTVAIGRGVVDDGWLGVTAVEVADSHRRQGLATAVMRALEGWGLGQGARRAYLQVAQDNAPALRLYAGLGYHVHHEYRYRLTPATTSGSSSS